MTAKEYMQMAFDIDQRINSKLEQMANLRRVGTMGNNVLSDMPGSPNRSHGRMEATVFKIMEMEKEIDAETDKLIDLKAEMHQVIDKLKSPVYRMVLEKRYIKFLDWKTIAEEMGYHVRSIYKVHKKALAEIEIPEWAKKEGIEGQFGALSAKENV